MRPSTTTGTPTQSPCRGPRAAAGRGGQRRVRALHDVRDALLEQRLGHRVDVERIDLVDGVPLPAAAQVADVDQAAQPVLLALPAGDRDDRGAGDPVGLLSDDLEHLLEPVRGGDRARHGDQRAQLRLARRSAVPRRCEPAGGDGVESSTASSASTVRGQNCAPAWRISSARASPSPTAARYGRSDVIACQASQARQMRLASGIASPASPSGIAAAVPALVLGAHRGREVRERGDRADDALAHRGVRVHDPPLRLRQRAGLLQDRVGDAELADVVQQRDLGDLDHLALGEAELLRHGGGDADDRLGVLGGVVLARLERREQRLAGDRLALQPRGAAAVEPAARPGRR